jgi:ABC-2 type transport system ATP-binding protein
MTLAIRTTDLSRSFKSIKAVDSLSLNVPEGSVYGFLGPNGAGKTTTIKMLTGFIKPDSGVFEIMGKKVSFGETEYMKKIGFLPDVPSYYNYMTAPVFLKVCAELSGTGTSVIPSLLEKTGLSKHANKKIGSYSRGMKQRLGIAQALVNNPSILILDEPVSALDPMGRKDVLDIINSLKGEKTVFFSTHILSDVERICDYAAILNNGKLLVEGSIGDIKKMGGEGRIILQTDGKEDILSEIIRKQDWSLNVSFDGSAYNITVTDKEKAGSDILKILVAAGCSLRKYEHSEPTLEDIFVKAVNE